MTLFGAVILALLSLLGLAVVFVVGCIVYFSVKYVWHILRVKTFSLGSLVMWRGHWATVVDYRRENLLIHIHITGDDVLVRPNEVAKAANGETS